MTAEANLTRELRRQVLALETDLRGRLATLPAELDAWRSGYADELAQERTARTFEDWRDERITLAAVGWVLTTVFIRFCEDNGLVAPVWITHARSRRQEALDAQQAFVADRARGGYDVTDRDWLLHAVGYLRELPATRGLVDDGSAISLLAPSGDGAAALLAFWRERDDDGQLLRDLTDPDLDTRFLGDLYQDVSEAARDRYALLQTPEFVEEFILDRTLDPALAERPLDGFAMVDPACGSGHFLLGAFVRLLDRWHANAPGMDERERVQQALDAVHGVDVNPYAVAIARFRLTIAALRACGLARLEDAPAFGYHLAVGDSLLHGVGSDELDFGPEYSRDRAAATFTYGAENLAALRRILQNGRYDAVVANPPYITVKDAALNQLYRQLYTVKVQGKSQSICKGKYAMTVPFMQRLFALAKTGPVPGRVGQITSNSFMKREFGTPLIETFLPTVDLDLVADTSGAYIPGHGTPTVILVGRSCRPVSPTIRSVLGVRGEPGRPDDAAKGKVWSSIVEHVDEPGWNDEWISVTDLDRAVLAKHPWSLSGGGALELLKAIEAARVRTLRDAISGEIGFASFPGADDVFFARPDALGRARIPASLSKPLVVGEVVRDWCENVNAWALAPYGANTNLVPLDSLTFGRYLWPMRTILKGTVGFGGVTRGQAGDSWWGWYRWVADRYRTPLSIAFAFVATHNHFVLDRGGKVFNRSAPVIKLREGASEDDHLALLGVLNSSTACFWLKQNSHDKGNGGYGGGIADQEWERFYEFTGTTLQDFPLPAELPRARGRQLDALAAQLAARTPEAVCSEGVPARAALDAARAEYERIRAEMIAQQEELDWRTYRLYGLVDEDLTYAGADLPGLALGERAFEIRLARRIATGEEQSAWFARHGSTPITQLPEHWPAGYRDLVARRIELAETHPYLRLLERPEHKRRWATEPWEVQEERALRGFLLDRLEDRRFWFDTQGRPTPRSVANLADDVARDPDLIEVLALWEGRPDVPAPQSLLRLLGGEAVPFLAAHRYTAAGLRKRAAWEHTWELQRREDAGSYIARPTSQGGDGPIPVPPKYTGADFRRHDYWSHRGKLDVPKERFVSYPGAGRDTDPTPTLGWAGWDHAERALALATLLQQREDDGWADERLVPLVAGLAELLPWLRQWHAAPDPFYGGTSPAAFFGTELERRKSQVQRTEDQLRASQPEPARRGRKGSGR